MSTSAMERTYYQQAELVIKHTFIEFRCLDEDDSPKLRRHKSDPLFACANLTLCDTEKPELEVEPPTPTTCADDDEESLASSPFTPDEDDTSSQGNKFCFSSAVINELMDVPTAPSHDATRSFHSPTVWPQSFTAPSVLSTCPLAPQVGYTSCPPTPQAGYASCPPMAQAGYASCPPTPQAGNAYHANNSVESLRTTEDVVDDQRTTLMVRNLPADLSQPAFVQQFKEAGYGGLFDFVYMPINFRASGNFGYAFVNFASHAVAAELVKQMPPLEDDDSTNSRWVCVWSTCQGFSANVERYRNSPLMHETVPWECKPAVYDNHGTQVQFPKPTKNISKPRIHWPGTTHAKKLEQ